MWSCDRSPPPVVSEPLPQTPRTNYLADGNFVQREPAQWHGNDGARWRSGRIVLQPGGQISQGQDTSTLLAEHYLLRVDARSLEDQDAKLRLQAVWLPEGGWQAVDAAGRSLVDVDAEAVHLDATLRPYSNAISKPEMAQRLVVYLRNDGKVPLEILQARVVERPIDQAGR